MSVEVEDKEFVALNTASIKTLLATGGRQASDRRSRERRREKRWPFPGTVQFWVKDRFGEDVQILGTCDNMNEQGIGVLCGRALEVGLRLPIAIHQPEATYHGEGVVRHCTPWENEYFIGIELSEAVGC